MPLVKLTRQDKPVSDESFKSRKFIMIEGAKSGLGYPFKLSPLADAIGPTACDIFGQHISWLPCQESSLRQIFHII